MRVLIVDDNLNFGRFLCGSLKKVGYEAHLVGSVREAAEAAGHESYDLFLLDVRLPDGDGRTLAADLLGRSQATPDRVVLTTALERGCLRNTSSLSSHPVLHKPFRLARLLELLRECVPTR